MQNKEYVIAWGMLIIGFLCWLFVFAAKHNTDIKMECVQNMDNIQLMPATHMQDTYVLTTIEPVTCYLFIK